MAGSTRSLLGKDYQLSSAKVESEDIQLAISIVTTSERFTNALVYYGDCGGRVELVMDEFSREIATQSSFIGRIRTIKSLVKAGKKANLQGAMTSDAQLLDIAMTFLNVVMNRYPPDVTLPEKLKAAQMLSMRRTQDEMAIRLKAHAAAQNARMAENRKKQKVVRENRKQSVWGLGGKLDSGDTPSLSGSLGARVLKGGQWAVEGLAESGGYKESHKPPLSSNVEGGDIGVSLTKAMMMGIHNPNPADKQDFGVYTAPLQSEGGEAVDAEEEEVDVEDEEMDVEKEEELEDEGDAITAGMDEEGTSEGEVEEMSEEEAAEMAELADEAMAEEGDVVAAEGEAGEEMAAGEEMPEDTGDAEAGEFLEF